MPARAVRLLSPGFAQRPPGHRTELFNRLAARCRGLRLAVAAFAVAVALAPAVALAEPSAADRETARTLMKQGDSKVAAKDFASALKDYQAAHAIMQVPITGLALAKTQIELGQLVEARDTLLGIARLPKPVVEAAPLARAREEAGPLAQKLAERIPSLSISVDGPPAGAAQVTVDGAAVLPDTLGTPRKVNPGAHVVVAAATGFQNATRNVSVKEGETSQVAIRLVPGAGGAPITGDLPKEAPGGGHIHVVSPVEPGNVILDGKAVGATPLDIPVRPGTHTIEVEYPGGSHEERKVNVGTGGRVEVEVKPSVIDALARYRRGPHFGFIAGPSLGTILQGGETLFGVTAGPVLNVGITPTFEFETGLTPSFHYHHDFQSHSGQILAVVPAMLRAHVSPWFMASAGITGGVAFNLGNLGTNAKTHVDYVVGPEWQLLMVGGGKREFEVGVEQGFHFGSGPSEFHQMLVFSYLLLD